MTKCRALTVALLAFALGMQTGAAPVSPSQAVVSLVQAGGTEHYQSLGEAFRAIAGPAEILVLEDCTLAADEALTVTNRLVIRADAAVTVRPVDPKAAMSSAFTVGEGGSLTFSNLCFNGFVASCPFVYADGGSFILEDASLVGIRSNGKTYGSPVTLDHDGRFEMRRAAITDCAAVAGNGGAVRLFRSGCAMAIEASEISGCSAPGYGGGVYVAAGAELRVSTGARILGNTAAANDVYLAGDKSALTVAGALPDRSSVGVTGGGTVTRDGSRFALLAPGLELDAGELEMTAKAFVNEGDARLTASVSETADGLGFVWTTPGGEEHLPLDEEDWYGPDAYVRVIYPDGSEAQWKTTQWAFESLLACDPASEATVILLQDTCFDSSIVISNRVTLTSAPASGCTLSRARGCDITVARGAELTVAKLEIRGTTTPDDGPSGSLIKVNGGALTLDDGAELGGVYGTGSRAAGAVVVWNDGVFTMLPGSCVTDCLNDYVNVSEGTGVGAGVLVDAGEARLYGGYVTRCSAYKGAGVFIGNKADLRVKGDFCAFGNTDFKENQSNLCVSDLSGLVLEDTLDGVGGQVLHGIGYTEGVRADPVVFGRLSESYPATLGSAASDASLFVHDLTGDRGVLVTNSTAALLVWSRGISADGIYVDASGSVFAMVDRGYDITVTPPTPIPLVYTGEAQTGVPSAAEYAITGNVGTNAGSYTAVATLKPGYAWPAGGTDPLEIPWSIAKAVYDLSDVTFADETRPFTGGKQSLKIGGKTPNGVAVSYEGNGQLGPGTFTVTAKFTGDATNYEPIPDMTAVLTIVGDTPPPDPPPDDPEVVHPTPIAFRSIEMTDDDEWTLVVTNVVPFCNYRLLSASGPATDFTPVSDWVQIPATAPVAWTNVITTDGGARFWRAEAKDGEKPASN